MASQKALVVDDSKLARLSLRKQLQKYGLDVAVVESGQDAIKFLNNTSVDIVFMDYLMPDMNGFEALKSIKQNPRTHDVPIIMCTSREEPNYASQAISFGAADTLKKPAMDDKITAVLNNTLTVNNGNSSEKFVKNSSAPTKPVVKAKVSKRQDQQESSNNKQINALKSQVKFLSAVAAEQEQHLKQMRENLKKLEKSINIDKSALSKEISKQLSDSIEPVSIRTSNNFSLIDSLAKQQSATEQTVNNHEDVISDQLKSINIFKEILTEQNEIIATQDKKISELKVRLKEQNKNICDQTKQFEALESNISDREQLYLNLENKVSDQESIITKQSHVIKNLDSLINTPVKETEKHESTSQPAPINMEVAMSEIESQLDFKLQTAVDDAVAKKTTPEKEPSIEPFMDQIESLIDKKINSIKESLVVQKNGISDSDISDIAQFAIKEAFNQQPTVPLPASLDEEMREELIRVAEKAGKEAGISSGKKAAQALFEFNTESSLPMYSEKLGLKMNTLTHEMQEIRSGSKSMRFPIFIAVLLGIIAIILQFMPN